MPGAGIFARQFKLTGWVPSAAKPPILLHQERGGSCWTAQDTCPAHLSFDHTAQVPQCPLCASQSTAKARAEPTQTHRCSQARWEAPREGPAEVKPLCSLQRHQRKAKHDFIPTSFEWQTRNAINCFIPNHSQGNTQIPAHISLCLLSLFMISAHSVLLQLQVSKCR